MVKSFLLLSIGASLFANSDYVPLSKFSKDQQVENNFIRVEKKKIEKIELKDNIEEVKQINEIKIGKPISQNIVKEEKTEIKNKDILKEYKQDNILKDEVNFADNTFSKNFSITPKFSYSYMQINGYHSGKINLKENKGVFIPEISLRYYNNILKLEGFKTKAFYDNVIIGGEDLYTETSWYKLHYLYNYRNAKIGLAYNRYVTEWNFLYNNSYYIAKDKQNFPSLELHLKNQKDKIQAEYGVSYGRNSNVKYAYEYYINLGYKILKDDLLTISAGYKNRTIDNDGSKFVYKGPIISLTSTF